MFTVLCEVYSQCTSIVIINKWITLELGGRACIVSCPHKHSVTNVCDHCWSRNAPLPNSPRSPQFLAELQSLNWVAKASNFSSPDLICSMYSKQEKQIQNKSNILIGLRFISSRAVLSCLTLNKLQGLVFRSCDILFPPGRRTTWLIVLHQEVRAANLSERRGENKLASTVHVHN